MKVGIDTGLIILLAAVVILQWNCNRRLGAENDALRAANVLVAEKLGQCVASAERQNAAVDSLMAAGVRQEERLAESYEEAVVIKKSAREAADRALIEPVSALCDSASIWGATKAEHLTRLWRKQ